MSKWGVMTRNMEMIIAYIILVVSMPAGWIGSENSWPPKTNSYRIRHVVL